MTISFLPFREGDINDVVFFLMDFFPRGKDNNDEDLVHFYKWKYFQGRGLISPVPGFIARRGDNGAIIGFIGCLPFSLRDRRGVSFKSAWVCDWFVRPEYSGMGIGKRLLELAGLEVDVLCGTRFSKTAASIISRQGFVERIGFQQVTVVINPTRFFLSLRTGIRKSVSLLDLFRYKALHRQLPHAPLSVQSISMKRFMELYSNCEYSGLTRTLKYLEWITSLSICDISFFECTLSSSGSECIAFCILKSYDRYGRRVAKVVDVTPIKGDSSFVFYTALFGSSILRDCDYAVSILEHDTFHKLSAYNYFYRTFSSSFWYRFEKKPMPNLECLHHHLIDKDDFTRMIRFVV